MILALAVLVTPISDSLMRRFTLRSRVGPDTSFAGYATLRDDYLGNIDMPFTGIESALFSIDEGSGRHERAALFEFDESDRLVHQVHYIFDSVLSEETRRYEEGRLVSWTFSAEESSRGRRVELQEFAYDGSGRLKSTRKSVDGVEQSDAGYSYSSDGQVIERVTEFTPGIHPKVTTTRIQSNLFGYVTREWRQEDGGPEQLVRRYEYDERGRIKTDAFVNAGELFTHGLTYSESGPAWRARSIHGPDGRLLSKETSFLSASGKCTRDEYLDYDKVLPDGSLIDGGATSVTACRYDEQGCLVRSLRKNSTTRAIDVKLRSMERDQQGTVTGWQEFRASGSHRVMERGWHVHINLKYRTAPR